MSLEIILICTFISEISLPHEDTETFSRFLRASKYIANIIMIFLL